MSRYPHRDVDPSPLGEPLHLHFSGRTAKNRLMKAGTPEKMASWHPADMSTSGIPRDELATLYRRWADGGFGINVTGNIMVDPTHLDAPKNMMVPVDAPLSGPRFAAFQRLAEAGKANGALLLGQLSHPGRQCPAGLQPNPVSASDVGPHMTFFGGGLVKPHPASREEIRAITAAFVHAAAYLDKAGFDGVQLDGANGYLLALFLSGSTNLRTDEYGGESLENRARLVTEIADGIRAATRPDFILAIKVNSIEFRGEGFKPEEAAELCRLLEAHRFDLVELRGATFEDSGSNHGREASYLEFAEGIVAQLNKTRAFVTGGLRSAGAMVDALRAVDGVGLGRSASAEPELAKDLIAGRVKACLKPAWDDGDWGFLNAMAGLQLQFLAKGMDPVDLTDSATVEKVERALASWVKAVGEGREEDLFDHWSLVEEDTAGNEHLTGGSWT